VKLKRILILIPSLKGGGAERVLINLLNSLDLEIYEIDLFIGVKGGVLEKEIPSKVNINFIFPNEKIEKLTYLTFVKTGSYYFFKYFGKKINKKYNVGISFLDSFYTEFLFHNNASINKKAAVIHSSYKSYKIKSKNINNKNILRYKKRYKKLDVIISVANEALDEFKSIFGEYKDMRVIYNPLNVKDILKKSNLDEDIDIETDKINLIAIGSHFPVKGYDKLIKSCAILNIKNINYRLNILGNGYLKDKHQRLINDLNLTDNIVLRDFVPNPYIWLKKSDIFIMTSEAEGLPTALCEAIVLHKPVMVTNVAGCREVIDKGKYGMMVENNTEAIAKGLEDFLLSHDKRLVYRMKSKERSKIFMDEVVINKYLELFNS